LPTSYSTNKGAREPKQTKPCQSSEKDGKKIYRGPLSHQMSGVAAVGSLIFLFHGGQKRWKDQGDERKGLERSSPSRAKIGRNWEAGISYLKRGERNGVYLVEEHRKL